MKTTGRSLRWIVGIGAFGLLATYGLGRTLKGSADSTEATSQARNQASGAEPEGSPRAILGRVWFDKYPSRRTDEFTLAIWMAGGIGLYETGTSYKATFEMFEFERRGSRLDMVFLQDKKKADVGFEIKKCDDKPPFDLCLTFTDAPRGPKTLYGFAYDDDEALHVPWAKGVRQAALARAGIREGR